MIKIDNSLLQQIGLDGLPGHEKDSLLKHIYETLEMRVGMRLADQMTNQQLDEFEQYFEAKDDAGAFKWLETNFPNYKDVVQEEFDKLKGEVQTAAPQIMDAVQSPQHAPGAFGPKMDPNGSPQGEPQLLPDQPMPAVAPGWQAGPAPAGPPMPPASGPGVMPPSPQPQFGPAPAAMPAAPATPSAPTGPMGPMPMGGPGPMPATNPYDPFTIEPPLPTDNPGNPTAPTAPTVPAAPTAPAAPIDPYSPTPPPQPQPWQPPIPPLGQPPQQPPAGPGSY